jgi:hypothetical protein
VFGLTACKQGSRWQIGYRFSPKTHALTCSDAHRVMGMHLNHMLVHTGMVCVQELQAQHCAESTRKAMGWLLSDDAIRMWLHDERWGVHAYMDATMWMCAGSRPANAAWLRTLRQRTTLL